MRRREGVHGGSRGVAAENAGDGVQEDALPVPARPVNEHECMRARVSGQAITGPLLEKPHERCVAARGLGQELAPTRALSRIRWLNTRRLCDPFSGVCRLQSTSAQIDRAARGVKKIEVAIPILGRDGKSRVAAGEALNAPGEYNAADLLQLASLGALGKLAAQFACEVESAVGVVLLPVGAG